jgi:hypothetical protein
MEVVENYYFFIKYHDLYYWFAVGGEGILPLHHLLSQYTPKAKKKSAYTSRKMGIRLSL